MRTVKRIVSLLLCAVLLVSFAPCVAAAPRQPVVFVPGYTGSRLVKDPGTPEETRVWKQKVKDKVVDAVKRELPGVAFDAAAASVGCYDKLFDTLAPYVEELIEPLRMNDDGTSKYNVETYPHSAADTRLDKLAEIGYYPDHDALVMLGNAAGKKNVYCCTLDWRYGQIDCAAVLDAYIREVLSLTGADKVCLMGVSFGGQVVMSYLTLYGSDAVSRVVLQCPALDGSSIVPQLLSGARFRIAWDTLASLVCTMEHDETDYTSLASLVSPTLFNHFLRAFIDRFLLDLFVRYGSVWDLVPTADYEALRDTLLQDDAFAVIRQKSDRYHTEVAAKLKETLQSLTQQGLPVAIVAGYGSALAVDNGRDSDGVIDLALATGAVCAARGKTLDNTPQSVLSPDGTADASCGYLPDRTWYVDGMMHGMGANESKVSALMTTLLLQDTIRDVHTSPEYPQFLTSQNAYCGVYCAFSRCAEGYCTRYSTQLQITNLSEEDSVTVDGLSCKGADLRFGYTRGAVLKPGESMTADVSGVLPGDGDTLRVTVQFVTQTEKGSVGRSRTQSFRFAPNDALDEVLTEDVTDADEIADTKPVRAGRVPFRAAAARCCAALLAALVKFVKLFRKR